MFFKSSLVPVLLLSDNPMHICVRIFVVRYVPVDRNGVSPELDIVITSGYTEAISIPVARYALAGVVFICLSGVFMFSSISGLPIFFGIPIGVRYYI